MKCLLLLVSLLAGQAFADWSVSTYNIRNFDHDHEAGATNLAELSLQIKSHQSDVMAFIEVVNLEAFKILVQQQLPEHKLIHSDCGGFGKQKLAILFNTKKFEYISHREDMSFSGTSGKCGNLRPVLLLSLKHKASSQVYVFGAVHLKAGGAESAMQQRWYQYNLLSRLTENYQAERLVLLGDFNTTGYNIRNQDFEKFDQFLKQTSMETVSEKIGCSSYWVGILGNGRHQSSILDHIILQHETHQEVKSVTVGAHCAKLNCQEATPEELGVSYQSVSDHCPIQVTFR